MGTAGFGRIESDREPVRERSEACVVDTPEPAFLVDRDGKIHWWNASVARLLGTSERAAIGRSCYEVIRGKRWSGEPICRHDCPILAGLAAGRGAAPFDMLARSQGAGPDGRPEGMPVVEIRHIAVGTAQGSSPMMLHLLQDVTERRRSEQVGARIAAIVGEGPLPARLTPREAEVFRLVAAGLSAREVAERLGIRHGTARNHIQRILRKLDAPSRIAAIMRMVATGEHDVG